MANSACGRLEVKKREDWAASSSAEKPRILMLGTRGIPAQHGGFETFVERLAPYLVRRGWDVAVYCQEEGRQAISETNYRGVRLIHVPVRGRGTLSTIVFDWISMLDALRRNGLIFSFGYPTGAFALLPRLCRRRHIINMDGIEWKRTQFGGFGRVAYYINERLAAMFGHRLVADHPCIADHLATRVSRRKITTIAYGADEVTETDPSLLDSYGIKPGCYALIVARPEPDNSILELVRAFSLRERGRHLVVLGNFDSGNAYHIAVRSVASAEVIFPGAIYDNVRLQALRRHARFYAHGHRVGGTNPSLVEALGAASATLAHDNPFNRWVARDSAVYFLSEYDADREINRLFSNNDLVFCLQANAKERFETAFTWPLILDEYHDLLAAEARFEGG